MIHSDPLPLVEIENGPLKRQTKLRQGVVVGAILLHIQHGQYGRDDVLGRGNGIGACIEGRLTACRSTQADRCAINSEVVHA